MILTTLQPLLILAAIAIVGGVPLLGAVSPGASPGMSQASAHCGEAESRGGHRLGGLRPHTPQEALAGTPATHCTRGLAKRGMVWLGWSVRGGTSDLPPPRA